MATNRCPEADGHLISLSTILEQCSMEEKYKGVIRCDNCKHQEQCHKIWGILCSKASLRYLGKDDKDIFFIKFSKITGFAT